MGYRCACPATSIAVRCCRDIDFWPVVHARAATRTTASTATTRAFRRRAGSSHGVVELCIRTGMSQPDAAAAAWTLTQWRWIAAGPGGVGFGAHMVPNAMADRPVARRQGRSVVRVPGGTDRVRVRFRQVTLVPVDAPRVTETRQSGGSAPLTWMSEPARRTGLPRRRSPRQDFFGATCPTTPASPITPSHRHEQTPNAGGSRWLRARSLAAYEPLEREASDNGNGEKDDG